MVKHFCVKLGLGIYAAVCEGSVCGGHFKIGNAAGSQSNRQIVVLVGQGGYSEIFEVCGTRGDADVVERLDGRDVAGLGKSLTYRYIALVNLVIVFYELSGAVEEGNIVNNGCDAVAAGVDGGGVYNQRFDC